MCSGAVCYLYPRCASFKPRVQNQQAQQVTSYRADFNQKQHAPFRLAGDNLIHNHSGGHHKQLTTEPSAH